jgi:TonB-dependent starch-binding outer membrane protein SusC
MKKTYKRLSTTVAMLFMLASIALAQERTVSGRVTDETGSGMPGVNVLVRGTSTGTAADADGRYTISVPGNDAVLIFSFIGYQSMEVPVGGRTTVDTQMTPDVQTLTELVVTGYSTQRKKDITGAVSVVKVDELQSIQAPNIATKLEGRASGVTISTSGEPGEGTNIRIRGIGSFTQGNDPLWIIDGVRSFDKGNNWLNPNDVESIQVLKDASAASIYGSAASNGVIIVTTKKGKAGRTRVTYNGYYGIQKPVGGYDKFMIRDPLQMAEAMHQFYANSITSSGIPTDNYYHQYELNGTLPQFTWPIANLGPDNNTLVNPVTGADVGRLSDYQYFNNLIMGSNPAGTNWWNELFEPAPITEHNIGINGGNENAQFNFSSGYFRQDGTMIHTGYDRFTIRANSNFKVGKFSFGENLSLARSERISQIGSNQDNQNAITMTLLQHSITPVYDIAGNFAGAKALSNGGNPVAQQVRNKDNKRVDYRVFGNVYSEVSPTNYLKARSSFGVNYSSGIFRGFNFPTPENREPTNINSFNESWGQSFTWQWTNTVEFSKKLAEAHQVTALAGYEAIRGEWRSMGGRLTNYFSDNINGWYLNTGLADPSSRVVSSNGAPNSLVSFFGKVDYTFNDKYLLSATIRRDGSSRFAANERWGTFPAASLGWRVSAEPFMAGVTFVSDLKLRAGFGVTGNQDIDAGNPFDRYGGSPGSSFYDISGSNNNLATGYALTNRGNPNTKWESTVTTNVGIDLMLFDDRLSVVVDVYRRKVEDLLYRLQVAGTAGSAAQPFTNVGNMENKGIDIGLEYRGRLSDDLRFSTSLNATHYRNKVLFVNPDLDFFYSGGADGHNQYVINKVGHPMASFYGYKYAGVYRTEGEVAAGPDQGIVGGKRLGGLRFADLDGDGQLTSDGDRTVIGNPHPDLTLGLNLGLNYKNFDFNMFLFASIGNDIYNYQRYYYEFGRWGSMFAKHVLTDTWTEDRPDARLPQLNIDNQSAADVASSYYIEDGSYLRARTVQFGYTVPNNSLSRFGVSNMRFYVQAQNLFTITGYSGIDPVLSNVNIGDGDANDQYLNTDLGNYPSSRIYSVGLSLNF